MVSVIIPTYNRAKMVADCISSVLATTGVELEVIVVDDCSTDDTPREIAHRFSADSRVRYFRNAKNSQLALSRLRGAQEARGELLLFLDDDNLIEPKLLGALQADFAQFPNAGLLAPLAIQIDGEQDGTIWTLGSDFNRWTSQPADYLAGIPLAELPTDRIRFPTTYSPNAFMVRKSVFEKVGGFDLNLPYNYDDADLGWRIRALGLENWILSTARTRHLHFMKTGDSPQLRRLGINAPWRAYSLGRNRPLFARKHFTFLQALSVTLVFAPLSAVYYGGVALKNRRPDIAWAYLKGTLAGIFAR